MNVGDIAAAIDGLLGAGFEADAWKLKGACIRYDPDLWHQPPESSETAEAVRICNTECGIRDKCLAYAFATDSQWGVFGGLTEKQRRKIKENSDAA